MTPPSRMTLLGELAAAHAFTPLSPTLLFVSRHSEDDLAELPADVLEKLRNYITADIALGTTLIDAGISEGLRTALDPDNTNNDING